MRISLAAAIIAASAATSACGQMHDDGGPTVSRNFQVGNFHQIKVAGNYDVTVQTGANPGVAAEGSQKLLDKTIVEVRGDELLIHPEDHNGFSLFHFGTRGKAHFTVTVPQLTAATLAGSGNLDVNGVSGDHFEGTLAGSGDLGIGSANLKSMKLSLAGSGDVKVGSGQVESAEYSIVGAGDVDASGVTSQQVKVSIAGSGDFKAHATGTADVSIMGAGDVTVTGGAKCSVHKSGAGDVHCS
jgi:hypothetical protein